MKISYRKNWDSEGTCYNQTVTIPKDKSKLFIKTVNNSIKLTLDSINNKEVLSSNDFKLKCYLKPIQLGINYTTLTTKDFICNSILGISLLDRNTIFYCK